MPDNKEKMALANVDPQWAWAAYEPSSSLPWGLPLASHLLRRAGFGATWSELQNALTLGPKITIGRLLQPPKSYASFCDEFDAHEAAAARSGDVIALEAWWLKRLRESPWPLLEKLTLFWHEHFAIRALAVADLKLMHAHVCILRKHALQGFSDLLGALADDPAMYVGLGGEQNRKAQPNLQFARPWLEAFTVGKDATTPSDVTNLARAWTGWFVYGGKLRFIEREHDSGSKKLLGCDGSFGRDDAGRLLVEHPATARHLAWRLFRGFISESVPPPEALLAPLADRIHRKAPMLEVLQVVFRSNLFFSGHALGQRIKSPVELAVGFTRALEVGLPCAAVAGDLANLGQRLGAPPTVCGWAGGSDWLNTLTLPARLRLCESLVRGSGVYGGGLAPAALAARNGFDTPGRQARFLIDLLLPHGTSNTALRRIADSATASPQSSRAVLQAITNQPEFQLS